MFANNPSRTKISASTIRFSTNKFASTENSSSHFFVVWNKLNQTKLMRIWLILLISISTQTVLSQFSPIWSINNNFDWFEVDAFEMNESGQVLLVTNQYNGGQYPNSMIYYSSNYGVSWDSTLMIDRSMMDDNAIVTNSGNMYFSSVQTIFPVGSTPGYQRKVFHSSLDGGATWTEKTIDSLFGSNYSKSLTFINDSVGMFFYQSGKYLTMDYGATWQKIAPVGAEHLGKLDDRFIFYWYQSAKTIDPYSGQIDSFSYAPFCEGNVDLSLYKNGVSYRKMLASDGEEWGIQYFHNYAAFNIDELPLGDQRVIHFPQVASLRDFDVTESCIHLVLGGRYARSCDGGDTFHYVDVFNTNGYFEEEVYHLEFLNDTVGYVITQNLTNWEWRLWKTTNGGGQNMEQVLTVHSEVGLNENNGITINIFPNPVTDLLTVEAGAQINSVELFSVLGESLFIKPVNADDTQLDMSNLPSGNYILKLVTETGIQHKKIVKD